jgi:DNA-binding transcriptional LysR family regulator
VRFSLGQLEAFYWVARLGSFRGAARQLNLTQPSVSLRIRELERTLGRRLLDRAGQRVELTRQGALVLEHAQKILALSQEIDHSRPPRDALDGVLRIGAADTFALTCLPDLLADLEQRHPSLEVEVTIDYSWNLGRLLESRALDLAFMTEPGPLEGVAATALGRVELGWVASPRMALPEGQLRARDLQARQIITNPPPSHLHASIMAWFREAELTPSRLSTCNSLSVMARLTVAGFGVAALPLNILTAELQAGLLRVLPTRRRLAPHMMCLAHLAAAPAEAIEAVDAAARRVMERARAFAPP